VQMIYKTKDPWKYMRMGYENTNKGDLIGKMGR
jgi:hypothetical protein